MDQGSTRKRSAVHNFAPTVTKFCVMWEGQALPHDTKFGNSRCEIVGRRMIFIWSLIHGSSWSSLIKVGPGECSTLQLHNQTNYNTDGSIHLGHNKMAAIFQTTVSNEFSWMKMYAKISITISLKFVPKGQINNIPASVWIMAWRRPGDNPLSETMIVSLLTHTYASLGLNELTDCGLVTPYGDLFNRLWHWKKYLKNCFQR